MLRRRDVLLLIIYLGFLSLSYPWLHPYLTKLTVEQMRTRERRLLVNTYESFSENANQSIPMDTKVYKSLRPKGGFRHAQDAYYGKGCRTNLYRNRLKVLLNIWGKVAKRRSITRYFIAYGSFLGSVRNADIVPYDSDIDVCMFRSDYHKLFPEESRRPVYLNNGKFHLLLQKHSPHPQEDTPRKDCEGNMVRNVTDDCAILDPHARLYQSQYVYLDIFVLEDFGAQIYDEYDNRLLKRKTILPVRPCRFLGLRTYCPRNAQKYLTAYYGESYMTPHHVCNGGEWVKNMADARERLL